MTSPGNQHCANCIGTLSLPFPIATAAPFVTVCSHHNSHRTCMETWKTTRVNQDLFAMPRIRLLRLSPLNTTAIILPSQNVRIKQNIPQRKTQQTYGAVIKGNGSPYSITEFLAVSLQVT